ncbi:LysR family transcriptional regulator [Acinetobacter sp.]|uniref:LysR family transcriptional regulator n=1 Tax=Acinetobacter sp. TaxID=472 RepID=UPI0031D850E2
MRLDFFDLQLILNIVATGSLTKGADCSAISLQATSERIKKLEQYFDTPLFIRHHSGVKLTPAGQVLIQHAQQLRKQRQQLEQDMQRFRAHSTEQLILWCNSSAQSEYLPMLLPQYLLQHPQLSIDLHEAESSEIVTALCDGKALLGLVSNFFNTQNLQTRLFADDPLVLICPIQHPLTQQNQIELADALHYDFIGLKSHHSLQRAIEHQAQLLGFNIQYRLRLPDFSAIAEVVTKGIGVAIVPARAAMRLQSDYAFTSVPLKGAWANRQLLLVTPDFQQLPDNYQQFAHFLVSNQEYALAQ